LAFQGRPLDLVLSTNLVIRTVSKYSIAFYSVIVGDQSRDRIIIEWLMPKSSEEVSPHTHSRQRFGTVAALGENMPWTMENMKPFEGILEINDIAPMGVPEFLSIMQAEQNTVSAS
ncbi:hypothetical protein COOONC_21968, partial [Cooperia oncophora]